MHSFQPLKNSFLLSRMSKKEFFDYLNCLPGAIVALTEVCKMNAADSSIRDLTLEAARFLESHHVPSPRLEADLLLSYALGIERMELYKNPSRPMTITEQKEFDDLIKKRTQGVPAAYLRGKKEFFSIAFKVGPGVLIPRAETELVVEEGLKIIKPFPAPSILDLGTGSGAILISLLLERPDGFGIGVENSSDALQYAAWNANFHQLTKRIRLLSGNLFEPIDPDSKFDLIVSNPPYIPSEKIPDELRYEPREAFDGGRDGLHYYREIIAKAWRFLKSTGALILEIGVDNRPFIDNLPTDAYETPIFKKDLAGIDRVVVLRKKC